MARLEIVVKETLDGELIAVDGKKLLGQGDRGKLDGRPAMTEGVGVEEEERRKRAEMRNRSNRGLEPC